MTDDNAAQAAVVLQLLGRIAAYPRAELVAGIEGIEERRIGAALDSLAEAGVVEVGSRGVRTTEAVRRLDELGLIVV